MLIYGLRYTHTRWESLGHDHLRTYCIHTTFDESFRKNTCIIIQSRFKERLKWMTKVELNPRYAIIPKRSWSKKLANNKAKMLRMGEILWFSNSNCWSKCILPKWSLIFVEQCNFTNNAGVINCIYQYLSSNKG